MTDKDSISKVLLTNSNEHLLINCMYDVESNVYVYPLAKYDRWMHWIQNISERHRVNGQRNIYLKKNPEDENLIEGALREILNNSGNELEKLPSRIKKFNVNIAGSNKCF